MKKVDNSSYASTIEIGASKPAQLAWYFVNMLFFKSSWNLLSASKPALLRLFGAKVGAGAVIKPCVNIKYPWKLTIGDHCWIGEEVWIDNLAPVTLHDSVTLSQGALLLCGSHDATRTTFDFMAAPIVLEHGAWIGARAVVAGGVRARAHSILGINSVAEKDLEADTIYKGNPAVPVLRRVIA